jgi:hypothetical protein
MLENINPRNSVKTVTGLQVAQRSRGLESRRVDLAIDLMDGGITLTHLTLEQACAITRARPGRVNASRRARAGGSLARARHAKAIDRLIDRIRASHADNLLIERLDAITAPAIAA